MPSKLDTLLEEIQNLRLAVEQIGKEHQKPGIAKRLGIWAGKKTLTGLGALIALPFQIVGGALKYTGLAAIIAGSTATGMYVGNGNDIMDVPDKLDAWVEKHPEVGQAVERVFGRISSITDRTDITDRTEGLSLSFHESISPASPSNNGDLTSSRSSYPARNNEPEQTHNLNFE